MIQNSIFIFEVLQIVIFIGKRNEIIILMWAGAGGKEYLLVLIVFFHIIFYARAQARVYIIYE